MTCPAGERRAPMTDAEFWDDVVASLLGDDEADDITDDGGSYLEPCNVCGVTGACGYDDQGEPLIHAKGGQ